MRKSEIVYCSLPAASNDDRVYPHADRVDLTKSRPRHVAFNTGPHSCAGAHLAGMELRVLVKEWLKRVPEFRRADDKPLPLRGGNIMAIERLDITW